MTTVVVDDAEVPEMSLTNEEQAKVAYPIFAQYTLEELSLRTGYSLSYLVAIKDCQGHNANPRFRRQCAHFLKRTEDELFGEMREAA